MSGRIDDVEQGFDDLEQAFQHLGQREVLLDLLLAEGKTGLLELFADVSPIPGLRVRHAEFSGRELTQVGQVLLGKGFGPRARSRRKSITASGDAAILVASDNSPKLAKPSSRASSWRKARISWISAVLSYWRMASGAWSDARVT